MCMCLKGLFDTYPDTWATIRLREDALYDGVIWDDSMRYNTLFKVDINFQFQFRINQIYESMTADLQIEISWKDQRMYLFFSLYNTWKNNTWKKSFQNYLHLMYYFGRVCQKKKTQKTEAFNLKKTLFWHSEYKLKPVWPARAQVPQFGSSHGEKY